MHVLAIGASRHIGYFACLRLLAADHTVTYLLRKPEVFDKDSVIEKYIQEGRVKLIKGDATVRVDVQRAFEAATVDSKLDLVLFSVGGTPSFSLGKGFTIDPPNLCSSSIFNVLASLPDDTPTSPQTKLVVISSHGLTKTSHNALPFLLKPVYSYALHGPHSDKLVMERAIFHAANWTWPEEEPKDTEKFLGKDWQGELPAPGHLKNITVIRPSLLIDGDDKPAKGKYRATTDEIAGAYTITRKDVAHFVVEGVLEKWGEWGGKVVNIST